MCHKGDVLVHCLDGRQTHPAVDRWQQLLHQQRLDITVQVTVIKQL